MVNILCEGDSSHVKIGKNKQQSKGLLFKDFIIKVYYQSLLSK